MYEYEIRRWVTAATMLLAVSVSGGCATSAPTVTTMGPPDGSLMPIGEAVTPPVGYLVMCRRVPETCGYAGIGPGIHADATQHGSHATADARVIETAVGAAPQRPAANDSTQFLLHTDGIADHRLVSGPPVTENFRLWLFEMNGIRPNSTIGTRSNGASPSPTTDNAPTVTLTPAAWSELLEVNERLNREIAYVPDEVRFGARERWEVATDAGDCEDIALAKRETLTALGWPPGALTLATAEHPDYGGHAVLLLRSDKGDLVLDNFTDRIESWERTPYRWKKRQVPGDRTRWAAAAATSPWQSAQLTP